MRGSTASALVLGLWLALAGCNEKLLDVQPPDQATDASFWKTRDEAVMAVNAIYPSLWGRTVLDLDAATDNAFAQKAYTAPYPYGNGSQDANSGWSAGIWDDAYRAIRRANAVLENVDRVPGLDPALNQRLRGEATFLRAYHYTNLVNLFGDVPLVLTTLGIGEGKVARTPRAQVVDQVLKDLDYAAGVLPLSYGATDAGRATRGAALALKARAALFAGRWDVAAQAAKAVMDLGVYGLHPNYRTLFTYAGEGSNEVILDRTQIKGVLPSDVFQAFGPRSALGISDVVPLRALADAYDMVDGLPITTSPLYDPVNPYRNRDPRLDATLLRPGATFDGQVYNSLPDSPTPDRVKNDLSATATGYNVLKYIDPADRNDRTNGGINFILIRYADVLLMYAEAKTELGQVDGTVYAALNQVRRRAGMPDVPGGRSQAQLRDVVRHERRVELALEGLRLFDLRRWGIGPQVRSGTAYGIDYVDARGVRQTITAELRRFDPARDQLWPIPAKELDLNPSLGQNPGY